MLAFHENTNHDREALEFHGIFYVDCIDQSSDSHEVSTRIHDYLGVPKPRSQTGRAPIPVPEHADQLREALLDSRHSIPSHALELFHSSERASIPQSAIFHDSDHHHRPPHERVYIEESFRTIVRECRSTARKFDKCQREGAKEHEWRRTMEDGIFRRCTEKELLSFDMQGHDHVFDAYEVIRQTAWKCHAQRPLNGSGRCLPSVIPDITFGFPILDQVQETVSGFQRMPAVSNFSRANLQNLSQRGLFYSPDVYHEQIPLKDMMPLMERKDDSVCFPFSTIHFEPVGRRQVSCRAANAASKTLTMSESLYRFAAMHDPGYHIPAVVAFTCTGSIVRVWTAYSLPSSTGRPVHIMTCIKQSDTTSTWAVLEMHFILRNLLRWATRVLKPSISVQLDYWRVALVERPLASSATPTAETPVSPIGALPTAAIKNHHRVNSLRDIELMALVRKLEDEKAELVRSNKELHERNAELAGFLKQTTGDIRDALCQEQRADSGMGAPFEENWPHAVHAAPALRA